MNLVLFVAKCFCHLHDNPCLEKKGEFLSYYLYFVGLSDYPWWFVLFLSFISQFLEMNHNFQVLSFNLLCTKCTNEHFYFVRSQLCQCWMTFFCYMWHTNLGLLFNIHFLLGLACVLPLMETMHLSSILFQRVISSYVIS